MSVLVDSVAVGAPVTVKYDNPNISTGRAIEMSNGLVFFFEYNKITKGIYFCALHGNKHCIYAQLMQGATNGLALLSLIVTLAPTALSAPVLGVLGNGSMEKMMEMFKACRIVLQNCSGVTITNLSKKRNRSNSV